MPLYILNCEACKVEDEYFKATPGDFTCPICGEPAKNTTMSSPLASGIIYSNVETSEQLGVTFNTQKEKDAYLKAKGLREIGKGSYEERVARDASKHRAEGVARSMGFNNLDHYHRTPKHRVG